MPLRGLSGVCLRVRVGALGAMSGGGRAWRAGAAEAGARGGRGRAQRAAGWPRREAGVGSCDSRR